MSNYKERLRHTLKHEYDTTVPERGLVVPDGEAEELISAALEQHAKGIQGALDDYEAACREYLINKGVKFRQFDRDHPGYTAFLIEDMYPIASSDPDADEICSLLLGIVLAQDDYPKSASSPELASKFALRMFLLGMAAEAAKLAPNRKWAVTGKKTLANLDKGNRSPSRQEAKEQRHRQIMADAEVLRKRYINDRVIAGRLEQKNKREGISPASAGRIRTILKEYNFYK